MDSSKICMWISSFKKFSRLRVKSSLRLGVIFVAEGNMFLSMWLCFYVRVRSGYVMGERTQDLFGVGLVNRFVLQ